LETIKDDQFNKGNRGIVDMVDGDGIRRPQLFGAGVSLGMFAGILIGSLVTLWLGEAAMDLAHRMLDRMSGKRDRINFELLLQ
jgi:hypothetical protein